MDVLLVLLIIGIIICKSEGRRQAGKNGRIQLIGVLVLKCYLVLIFVSMAFVVFLCQGDLSVISEKIIRRQRNFMFNIEINIL